MSVCFTDQKAAKYNKWSDVVVLVILPLLFMILRAQYIIHTTETPNLDFGSGSMFDQIANRYDLTNRFLALNLDTSWRRFMVKEVLKDVHVIANEKQKENDINLLDLATGTADVAILLAKEMQSKLQSSNTAEANKKVNIIGVDPSANMINVGNTKITSYDEASNTPITLQVGDARNLNEFKDSMFDGATMAFGIRNVPEKEIALCEIHRVLKKQPETQFAILEFSEPDENSGVLGTMARFFIRHIVPVLGATLSGAPKEYMHLQNSIKEFPSPAKFVELMEGLECKNDGKVRKGKVGKFKVNALHQLNFGSVQIYLATPYLANI